MADVVIDKLIRSSRKTVALQITETGSLIVRAPKRASLRLINNFVKEKEHWIIRHQEDSKKKFLTRNETAKKFIVGEEFLFLGQNYLLQMADNLDADIFFNQGFFIASHAINNIKESMIKWYYQQALKIISERVEFYAKKAKLKYQTIKIIDPKSLWASCGPDGKLHFSWRLVMAPLAVIDYVVAHELAHLVHSNHSKRFWKKVQTIMPEYLDYKNWLRDNTHLLHF